MKAKVLPRKSSTVLSVRYRSSAANASDELDCEICPNAPVVPLVGVGKRRMPDRRTKVHAIQPRLIGRQTGFDVAQTLAGNQLREGHGAELIDAYHEF